MFPNFARRLQQRSSSPATRLASTRTTQLALLLSAPSTVNCSRRACCLRLLLANAPSRCSHPRGPSISAPAGRAAPAGVCLPLSGFASLPAVPERQLLATPAVGHLSSESAVPTLQRLRLRLTPAWTVSICLWCPTSRASALLSQGHSPYRRATHRVHCTDATAIQLPLPLQLS